jgi:hypothetical protein
MPIPSSTVLCIATDRPQEVYFLSVLSVGKVFVAEVTSFLISRPNLLPVAITRSGEMVPALEFVEAVVSFAATDSDKRFWYPAEKKSDMTQRRNFYFVCVDVATSKEWRLTWKTL